MILFPANSASNQNLPGPERYILLLPTGLFFLGWSLPRVLSERALDSFGRPTTGHLISLRHIEYKRGVSTYATYVYQVDHQTFTQEDRVLGRDYDQAETGKSLSVLYLPSHPGTARLSDAVKDSSLYTFLILGGVLSVFGTIALVSGLRKWRNIRRARHGAS